MGNVRWSGQDNGHGVEAVGAGRANAVLAEKGVAGGVHAGKFLAVEGEGGLFWRAAAEGFDFHKHDFLGLAVAHDEVYFALSAGEVGLQNMVAPLAEKVLGGLFAFVSKLAAGVGWGHDQKHNTSEMDVSRQSVSQWLSRYKRFGAQSLMNGLAPFQKLIELACKNVNLTL